MNAKTATPLPARLTRPRSVSDPVAGHLGFIQRTTSGWVATTKEISTGPLPTARAAVAMLRKWAGLAA